MRPVPRRGTGGAGGGIISGEKAFYRAVRSDRSKPVHFPLKRKQTALKPDNSVIIEDMVPFTL
jgi:hypothetical protein